MVLIYSMQVDKSTAAMHIKTIQYWLLALLCDYFKVWPYWDIGIYI